VVTPKILALFSFIDYLDSRKKHFIEIYIPLCGELEVLASKRSQLKPDKNYIDKLEYDKVQSEISEKFKPITDNVYLPIISKLRELEIWDGDDVFTSIWNNNISAISDLKRNFTPEEAQQVIGYKDRYIKFRIETNSNFLSLGLVFQELDELLKQLFDFFKDTNEDEFESFETKTIEVNSLEDAIGRFIEAKGKNVRFSFPNGIGNKEQAGYPKSSLTTINTEIIMGDKYQVGDITNNSGQIAVGKNITISDSSEGRQETINKINELIGLIQGCTNVDLEKRETIAQTFGKVKEELSQTSPSKAKIFNWLVSIKAGFDTLVFSHEVTEAIRWISNNLNFVFL
jgi:hypothetical protein